MTGTTTKVSNDDVMTPPITAWPMGARCSEPSVSARAMKMNRWLACFCMLFAICAVPVRLFGSTTIIVSVTEQKLAVIENGQRVAQFPVSTSKYGLGDRPRSYATPLGLLEVASKVGAGAPQGAVFKSQHFTGEILRPNAPGRDPIVTRPI